MNIGFQLPKPTFLPILCIDVCGENMTSARKCIKFIFRVFPWIIIQSIIIEVIKMQFILLQIECGYKAADTSEYHSKQPIFCSSFLDSSMYFPKLISYNWM